MSGRRSRFDIRRNTRAILVGLGLWVAALAAFWFLMLEPKVEAYRALVDENGEGRKAIADRTDQVEAVEAYLVSLETAERDLRELGQMLALREERSVAVQAEVERITKQFGVSWDSINIENQLLAAQGLERMAMVVPLTSNYPSLRRFLAAVEASDEFLVVEQVSLGESADGTQRLQLNIVVATYFEAPATMREETRGNPQAPRRAGGRT